MSPRPLRALAALAALAATATALAAATPAPARAGRSRPPVPTSRGGAVGGPSGAPLARAGWPIPIMPNRGQAPERASHVVQGDGTAVLFEPDGFSLRRSRAAAVVERCGAMPGDGLCRAELAAPPPPDLLAALADGSSTGNAARGTVSALGWRFAGGGRPTTPVASAPTGGILNRFAGPRPAWQTRIPLYEQLTYHAVWPGVDVAFETGPDTLKHAFVVAPGADPRAIALSWHGATGLRRDDAGRLVVDAPGGRIVDPAPEAFQIVDGLRRAVPVAYAVAGQAPDGGWRYGFDVGAYDPALPLVVDPALVVSAGFIGSAGGDRGLGIEIDDAGAMWIVGELGPDAFAAKVSADGQRLLSLSVFDAEAKTAAFDIDVDAAGFPYLTGATTASEASFPVWRGPDVTYNGGAADAFVAKLTPDGADIVYAGFLGGAGIDFGEGIVVDAAGHAFVHGPAESTEHTFPVVIGPDVTQNGGWDAFVTQIAAEPFAARVEDNLVWSGFVGGSGHDVSVIDESYSSGHIALDADGNLYLSGQTSSTEATFPDGDGFGDLPSFDTTYNGGWDAYVAKIRADGSGLAYAGYIGGALDDDGKGMAIDATGAAYVTGNTLSAPDTFPATVGPDLTYNGRYDGFVAKVTPDGRRLAFCGYFGGDDDDSGQAVALGPDGALYLTGFTESTEATFPFVGGPDLTHNGPQGDSEDVAEFDALVGRMKFDVSHPDPRHNWDFLGVIGGDEADAAYWLDVDAHGDVAIVGDTASGAATFPDGDGRGRVPGLPDAPHGAVDAFVVQVAWRPPSRRVAYLPWALRGIDADTARATAPAAPFVPTASSTPEPTFRPPTATASPTPPPLRATAVPPGEALVFWDDFGDANSGWRRYKFAGGTVSYVDGMLELAAQPDEVAVAHAPGVFTGDGAVEWTMQRDSGAIALSGLAFGPATGGFYWWWFPDGRQALVQVNGEAVRLLVPVSTWPGFTNALAPLRLRLERDGARARGFANGDLVFDTVDPSLDEPGVVGLAVGGPEIGTARVRFDDLLVTRWTGARPTAEPPAPTATAAPTSTPPSGPAVLYRDDFSDPASGWLVADDADVRARYVDGAYEVAVHTAGIYVAAFAPRFSCADCAIEVTSRFLSRPFGRIGVALGERNRDALTLVEITTDGRYAIERTDGAGWTELAAPATSSAIRTGAGERNDLRVVRRGGRLSLVVNETTVTTVDVPTLADPGPAGIVVLSDEPEIVARFDEFVVRGVSGALGLDVEVAHRRSVGQDEPPPR